MRLGLEPYAEQCSNSDESSGNTKKLIPRATMNLCFECGILNRKRFYS